MAFASDKTRQGAAGVSSGYEIANSLRFNDDDSAYLSRTPSSASNRQKWTWSGWVKFTEEQAGTQPIFAAGTASTYTRITLISSGNHLSVMEYNGEWAFSVKSSNLIRDFSNWYHIVVALDTTQATASNRVKMYINGEAVTSFFDATYPSQNFNTEMNNTVAHYVSKDPDDYLDCYQAEVNFIDGTAELPSAFGESGDYGEWKPIEYTGTYGTNGFYLPMNQDYSVEGFSTVTYTGNGGTQYIGGTGFQPDFTWIKQRSSIQWHQLTDSIRGVGKQIFSNATSAEDNATNKLTAFNTDGFSLDSHEGVNGSGATYVAWNWDMGGSTVSNTDGTITSSVRANTTYGQSIVSYTGTGSSGTVGHGLDSAPEMIICKKRSGDQQWGVQHTSTGIQVANLEATGAFYTSNTVWNTSPTASVFGLGTNALLNASSGTYIAYCFHSVTGYSKFGSYTGNGSTTGTVVTTGFKPAFLLIKASSAAEHWFIFDTTRDTGSNPVDKFLVPNSSGVEGTGYNIDFTSTGFQLKSTLTEINGNGTTYIYMAFADKREAAFWLDASGNNNDWTPNNLTESDVSKDSPTNNFATWNPGLIYYPGYASIFSEGNLKGGHDDNGCVFGSIVMTTGKWYAEMYFEDNAVDQNMAAVFAVDTATSSSNSTIERGISYKDTGDKVVDGTTTAYGATYSIGDIIGIAVDVDAGNVTFYKNNTSQGSTSLGAGDDHVFACGGWNGTWYWVANFGQDSSFAGNKTAQGNQDSNSIGDFYYTPPTGYLALCTSNLPDPAVIPSEHFNTVLYTGNNSTNAITGVGFQPDLNWIKCRSTGYNNVLNDVLRGTGDLFSDTTAVEADYESVSLQSDGFTLGGTSRVNANTDTFVAWNWKANGSGSSNTNGSINTTATSANVDAGFSISTYTGTGVSATIGHGLSKAPEMIIAKKRNSTGDWMVYANNDPTDYLRMNTTNASTDSNNAWDDTSPTATVWSVGVDGAVNGSGNTYVAYCFHSVDGYSKVGSYTGNGSSDGTFVYTGGRVAWLMVKRSDGVENWVMIDNKRHPINDVNTPRLYPNLSNSEYEDASIYVDYLSNGFKIRSTQNMMNTSGGNYIYLCFFEHPFKHSNAR